ncbi:MAG: hypothetical protein KJP18_04545 [Gemmatimonadetes bacterium]|nr:hypothetical protein [Gemmatimonadota bacterium]NNK63956.1 hypothetical protein [Gemmatimonadota bacterium]
MRPRAAGADPLRPGDRRRLFRQDLENSEAYTLADWHGRGPARRLAAQAAGVCAPWL